MFAKVFKLALKIDMGLNLEYEVSAQGGQGGGRSGFCGFCLNKLRWKIKSVWPLVKF